MNSSINYTLALEDFQEFQLEHLKVVKAVPQFAPKKNMSLRPFILGWAAVNGLAMPFLVFFCDQPWIPLTVFFLLIGPFTVLQLFRKRVIRGASKTAWEANVDLRQPRTVAFGADQIVIDIGTKVTQYRWTHFKHFHEGPSIFLLYVVSNQAEIIPKRAFASAEEMEAFRRLCQPVSKTHVPAFPVQVGK